MASVLKKKKAKTQPKKTEGLFSLVAIGASAGGLEAVSILLKHLPSDTGMAYFYIQHLSPDHISNLPELLSAQTTLKVYEARTSLRVKPNHVYVCTPNREISIIDGRIKLLPRDSGKVPYLPIDNFFKMVARQFGKRAVGVVLSGNATDGTIGLRAIKEKGGIAIVQDDTARSSGMPQSAMKGCAVDYVLPPELIARTLARLGAKNLSGRGWQDTAPEVRIDDSDPSLARIFKILLKTTEVDFSHYKLSTIKRRLNYRMINCGIESLEEYADLIARDSSEAGKLHRELLINVTSFFRDPPAFDYLRERVFPKLLRAKKGDEPLRIWVPACSTGEEAFTIAMILYELQEKKKDKTPVQIFATDLSAHVIREARKAEYTAKDLSLLSADQIKKFFTPHANSFRIIREIREMCVFAPHNILVDPPFSRMDFVSCCNLLIYFDAEAQKKALATLHFALNESGTLMLGKAETPGSSSALFNQLPGKFRIYSRKKAATAAALPQLSPRFPTTQASGKKKKNKTDNGAAPPPKPLDIVIDAMLLTRHMPPCVVVNKDLEILKFRGDTSTVLKHADGNASLNLLKMVAREATFELAKAMRTAIRTGKRVVKTGIKSTSDNRTSILSFEITPMRGESADPLFLIVFDVNAGKVSPLPKDSGTTKGKDRLIRQLQDELEATRLEMHSFIESQETSNADLQAANEEIVSTNEEFQTLNEELETSKEEMQATNEELVTTNQELQMRNDLLNESYRYSEAIIATIHEPMLVLDNELLVKSANDSFYKKFKATPKVTVGFSLFEIGNREWDIPALRKQLSALLLKNVEFQNLEVKQYFRQIGEKVMLLNAHRIVQKTHGASSILLAIEDITERYMVFREEKEELRKNIRAHRADKVALEKAVNIRTKELGQKNIELEALVQYATMGIMVVDENGNVVRTNPCLDNLFGYKKDELIGQTVETLIPKRYVKKHIGYREEYKVNPHARVMGAGKDLFGLRKDGSEFPVEISLSPYSTSQGNFVIGFIVDISVRKLSEDMIAEKNRSLEHKTEEMIQKNITLQKMNKELETFTFVSSHDLQEPLRKIKNFISVLKAEEWETISENGRIYLERTHETASRMQQLIEDLLAYSRSKKAEKVFVPVTMSEIIEEVKNTFDEAIREKSVSIEVSEDCTIDVIRFQMRQLLQNLIGNSIKFADPVRPLNITIQCHKLTDTALADVPDHITLSKKINYCHIAYKDTGIGFPKQYSKRIFEVFQRLHNQETYAGTGMGLAICKRIVENHDGEICASGKEGEGARFDIYLPCRHQKS